jgi:DNA-binding winged helix-turn-helix (wHTH) protein/TolB-like protein/tetratricopeptide (TPR) repeat protein
MKAPFLARKVYRFGLFEVRPDGKLLRQGVPVKLQEQPWRVLCALLERPGEIITRDELREALWPEGTNVEFDGSLNAALKRLRYALNDDANNPTFIQTESRRGYRFIAPVTSDQASEITPSFVEPAAIGPPGSAANEYFPVASHWASRRWWLTSATAVVVLLIFLGAFLFVGWRYGRGRQTFPPAPRKVIAVLPFSNEGAGPDFDYLRYAIASDLATDLTYTRSVSLRPFTSTTRYASQPVDPSAVGRELRVTHVVAGGFLFDHQNLRVNLELLDVAENQVVWREEFTVPPKQLVALHDQLALRTTKGLLPSMNLAGPTSSAIPTPRNEQALELFLHSVSIPLDPEPNLLAIRKLEESVVLDRNYAPAWGELARRYYIDFHYGNGGEAAAAKSLEADRRCSEIDPSWPSVSTTIRVERGDLNGAYDQAVALVRRNPDVALLHHALSVVFRSAGLLQAANKECQAALALDPGFNGFRSCAMPLILQGDYSRAQTYIRLDENSGFGAMLRMIIALRMGDTLAAFAESKGASQGGFLFADLVRLYLNHAPQAQLQKAATEIEADPRSALDPEMHYFNAGVLSFCGQSAAALRELKKAIQGNYCSYPNLEQDPLFNRIRQTPEFAELRHFGIQCQQSFQAHQQQVDRTLRAGRP